MDREVKTLLLASLLLATYWTRAQVTNTNVPCIQVMSLNTDLRITGIVFDCTNFVETVEPLVSNPDWYTNYYGTNLIVSGMALLTAHIGPTVRLNWTPSTNVVLQYTPSLDPPVVWTDLRIQFIGVGEWLASPMGGTFYRLRCQGNEH
jgi:hypothetical protein